MHRSEITIDLGAVRRNARRLLEVLEGSALWAVVKADGYGHGAVDVAGAVLAEGATALCVTTVEGGARLRREFPTARILVLGPSAGRDVALAREADLELAVWELPAPEGVRVHVKLDTGMGRWGLSELGELGSNVVGLMTHLATADSDPAFAREQLKRFDEATNAYSHLVRHAANSAAALRLPESRYDAARCGVALYGLSPFGGSPADDGLEPALRWESRLAQVKQLRAGESTGYGRRFIAEVDTWIGVVPVGYADGFRRDMTGTEVAVNGRRCQVVGTVSMDAIAVRLEEPLAVDTPVTLIGDGVFAEDHASVADTINYEVVTRIGSLPPRARRTVIDG
jgi:alanine racemase